jgi:predicted permease
MTSPGELLRRLRYLILRDRYAAELEEEIRAHIDHRAAALHARGLSAADARYEAKRRFGNPITIEERSRDMWGLSTLEHIGTDLRFATRRLRTRAAFSGAAIAVTALGIGATTAVFSAIDAALLRPLPFAHPEELYLIRADVPFDWGRDVGRTGRHSFNVADAAAMTDVFSKVGVYAAGGLNLRDAENPQRLNVGVVSRDLFEMLGVHAQIGRTFDGAETSKQGPRAVVLSDALWRERFGRRDMLGKSIDLNGASYTIVGIMPRGFDFPNNSDVWIPLTIPATMESFAAFRGYLPTRSVVRLAPGVTREAASSRVLAQWIALAGPPTPGKADGVDKAIERVRRQGSLMPFQTALVGDRKPALLMLMGATALLLLIACANVANLLLTDAASRRREVALREVLGASRGRITRQLLAESTLLAVIGAVIGIAIAPALLGVLRAVMPPNLAGVAPAHLDLRVLGFSAGLAVFSGVCFGLWPSLTATRGNAVEAIKSGGDLGSTAAALGRARRLMITAEIALTVMLLIGAGLMLRSLDRVMTQDRGMDGNSVATMEFTLDPARGSASRASTLNAILARLEGDPAIDAAAFVNDLPLRGSGGIAISVRVDGVAPPTDPMKGMSRFLQASGGYFRALGIPLLRGRTFTAADNDSLSPNVAIINMAMAKAWWPNGDALGRTFNSVGDGPATVIGIVADTRETSLEEEAPPQMYYPIPRLGVAGVALVARSSLPPSELLARLRAAVRSVDPNQAVYNVRMMDDVIAKAIAPRRTNTVLITIFGGLALLLSAFGIYAVISYSVAQRAREFGIRAALGASARGIAALVGRELVPMVAIGLAIGLAGAWSLSKVIASLLYGVEPHDPATFVVVPAVLAIPALVAAWPPIRRAMGISPMEVMRAE